LRTISLPFAQKPKVFSLVAYAENLTLFWSQKTAGQFTLGIRNPGKNRENLVIHQHNKY